MKKVNSKTCFISTPVPNRSQALFSATPASGRLLKSFAAIALLTVIAVMAVAAPGPENDSSRNDKFGMRKAPATITNTLSVQMNPGTTVSTIIPSNNFTGVSAGAGPISSVTITNFPVNATGITVNGILYTGKTFPVGGIVIPADVRGHPTQTIAVDPVNGAATLVITYVATNDEGTTGPPATLRIPFANPVPFTCSNFVYQVAGPGAPTPTTLYSYDINTGQRTTMGVNTVRVNAAGYNTADSLIWGFDRTNGRVVKMDATGATTGYTIPNLSGDFHIGDIIGNSYLFLYSRDATRYYVVDINPARSTYLQLVEPTAGFVLDTAPYGTALSAGIHVSDLTYKSATGLLYGMADPGAAGGNSYKVVTLNPLTGSITYAAVITTGNSIETEGSAFGSVFSDQNATRFFVFANLLGKFYQVNPATNTAVLLSSPGPSQDNDGFSCPLATLTATVSGTVFNDANGLADNTVNGTGTNAGGLFANLVDAGGNVYASTAVAANGTYSLSGIGASTYTIILTTTAQTVGSPLSSATLPSGYASSGENIGAGAGNDGAANSKLDVTLGSGDVTNANFGITAAGYIYIHKKALDESSSVDFPFNISGGTTSISSITLNDNPTNIQVKDVGSAQSGRLWAVGFNNILYYRDAGSSAWVQTSVTNASRVDGGAGNTAYVVTTGGTVTYTDGIFVTQNLGTAGGVTDVASGWDNQPYVIGASSQIFRYNGTNAFSLYNTTVSNIIQLDVNPATGQVFARSTDGNIYLVPAGSAFTNYGKPTGLALINVYSDIAVAADGSMYGIWQTAPSTDNFVFKWVSGTTWTAQEYESRHSTAITGGLGGEVWGNNYFNGTGPYANIITRAVDGSGGIHWLDDERVRTGPVNGNSIMVPVAPGTYNVTETLPSGWNLSNIEVYDPNGNTTAVLSAQNASVNVAAGEAVNLVYQNNLTVTTVLPQQCGSHLIQTFGSGTPAYAPPIPGVTAYHYIATAGFEDGYYTLGKTALGWANAILANHTGDANGYFLMVNASYSKDEFYRQRVSGLSVGSTYTLSFWAADLSNLSPIRPNITFGTVDMVTGAVTGSVSTGDISAILWTQYSYTFVATGSTVEIFIKNNGVGGGGNDLAIDDISFGLATIPTPLVSVTPPSCGNNSTATVTSPTGSNVEYSIDGVNFQSSPVFSNLAPGNYTITARFVSTLCTAATSITVKPTICGNVFNDNNGLTDNTVNGTGTNAGGLNAVLVNTATGLVVATAVIAPDGTYSFPGVTAGVSYSVRITTSTATIGSAPPAVVLPAGWVSMGEQNCINTAGCAGSDGTPNGILLLGAVSTNISQANFGITNNADVAITKTGPTIVLPGGEVIYNLVITNNGPLAANGATVGDPAVANFTAATVSCSGAVGGAVCPSSPAIASLQAGTLVIPTLPVGGTVVLTVTGTAGAVSGTTITNTATIVPPSGIADPVPSNNTGTATTTITNTTACAAGASPTQIPPASVVTPIQPTVAGATQSYGSFDITYSEPAGNNVVVYTATSGVKGLDLKNSNYQANYILSRPVANLDFIIDDFDACEVVNLRLYDQSNNLISAVPYISHIGSDLQLSNVAGQSAQISISFNSLVGDFHPNRYIRFYISVPISRIEVAQLSNCDGSVALYLANACLQAVPVGGNVLNDANGNSDNTVNGPGTNAGGLNAVLIDNATGLVAATVPVAADGTYNFTSVPLGNYSLEVTTNTATVVSTPPAVALPAGWVPVGEQNCGTTAGCTGSDGTPNGILPLGSVNAGITQANFGIERPPLANNASGSFTNPGGTGTVQVPLLTGSDPEQGTFPGTGNADTVVIKTLPAGGTLYYNGVPVAAGDTIKNYNPALLQYDPPAGAGTQTFTFSEIDAAGQASPPATVTMLIGDLTISGTVYDDPDGLTDGIINGTGTNAGGLNPILYDSTTNQVVAVLSVAPDGTYSIPGVVAGHNYAVMMTTNTAAPGDPSLPPAQLPLGWAYAGENVGTASGDDGSVDGILSIGTVTGNVANANVGILQICTNGTVYGLNSNGKIQPFAAPSTSGALNAVVNNTPYSSTSIANGIGYSTADGKFYFVNNGNSIATHTFISYDPSANTYAVLSNTGMPTNYVVRAGINAAGTGYYAVTGDGVLFYYNIVANTWTNISSVWKDQFGNTISSTISAEGSGDVAFDGSGNLWLLTSPVAGGSLHVWKMDAPLPTTTQASVTIKLIASNTSFASLSNGIAFTSNGEIIISNNANNLLKLNNDLSLTTIGAITNASSSIGDLTGCAFPLNPLSLMEYGDAPNSYGTTQASNGARHIPSNYDAATNTAKLMLGTLLDIEADGVPATAGAPATGDDLAAVDDEDAISTFQVLTTVMTTYSIAVNVRNTTGQTANLSGWVDFNKNGTFDAGEKATATVANNATTATLTWTGLSGLTTGNTYARFRIATVAAEVANPTGLANDGEVEDYQITIVSPVSISGNVFNDINGLTDNTVNGTGTNAGGLNVIIYDNTTGKVAGVATVAADGTYTLNGVTPGDSYSLYITTATATVGQTAVPTVTLPAGWVSMGEQNCINTAGCTGSDGTPNSILPLGVVSTNITQANFGITKSADIAITKSGTASVSPGGTVTYNLVITNNGPAAANGATVSDPAVANFTATSVVCNGATGGAACPSSPTIASLQAGTLAIPTLPVGGTVVLSVTGTAGPVSGTSIVNTATVAPPSGVTDPVPANNTGTATTTITNNTACATGSSPTQTPASVITPIQPTVAGATQSYGLFDITYSVPAGNSVSVYTASGGVKGIDLVSNYQVNYIFSGPVANLDFIIDDFDACEVVNLRLYDQSNNLISAVPYISHLGSDLQLSNVAGQSAQVGITFSSPVGDFNTNRFARFYITVPISRIEVAEISNCGGSVGTFLVNGCAQVVSIGGNVLNDANGNTDNTVNGPGTNAGGLNAVLINTVTGLVVATVPVAADGTYNFVGVPLGNYSVEVTTNTATVGSAPPAVALPAGWVPVGEQNCGTTAGCTGSDGTPNGILPLGAVNANITQANFGIERPPLANNASGSFTNPGGTNTVQVPLLTGSDPEQGTFPGTGNADTVVIKTLPAGGTLYYNGVPVAAGDTIKNYNPALLQYDPPAGAGTQTFTFSEIDAAGQASPPATVTMNFTGINIGGNVLNDGNGNTDNIVNGPGTNAGGLNAVLIDNITGLVVAIVPVAANGTYNFTGLPAGNYSLEVTTNTATVGSTPPAVALPSGWVPVGEQNCGTTAGCTGSDGTPNGILLLGVINTNVTQANFGIERPPLANNASGTFINPGGTNTVQVPLLTGSDSEQGTFPGTGNADTVVIKTLPAGGTLYYNGVPVAAGDTIKNYNPALLQYDPPAGAGTQTFTFSEIDAAGRASAPATVTMNFTGVNIGGNVLNDGNGNTDNILNGPGTNAGGLNAVLIDSTTGFVVATIPVAADGTYNFVGVPVGNYRLEITTNTATPGTTPPAVTLPAGWGSTGEQNCGTTAGCTGSDGTPNGILPLGTVSSNITQANFGINNTADIAVTKKGTNIVSPGGIVTYNLVITNNGPAAANGATVSDPSVANFTAATVVCNGAVGGAGCPSSPTIASLQAGTLAIPALPVGGTVILTVTGTAGAVSGTVITNTATVATPSGMTDPVPANNTGTATTTITNTASCATGTSPSQVPPASVVTPVQPTVAGATQSYGLFDVTYSEPAGNNVTVYTATGGVKGLDLTNNNNQVNYIFSRPVTNLDFLIDDFDACEVVNLRLYDQSNNLISAVPYLSYIGSDLQLSNVAGQSVQIKIPFISAVGDFNPNRFVRFYISTPISRIEVAQLSNCTGSVGTFLINGCSQVLSIGGNVFNDANGNTDNTVNGPGTNAGGLNAVLIDNATGLVVATVPVAADGTYNFTGIPAGNYSVEITTNTATVGSTPPAVALPAGWAVTGEQNCGTTAGCTGSDGTPNGILPLGAVSTSSITQANFGINRLPDSDPKMQTISYPAGGNIPAGTVTTGVTGRDPEDGNYNNGNTIRITQLPANATMLYNGVPVTLNQQITGFNPALLSYSGITAGSTSVVFNYAFIDAAGMADPTPAPYTVSWSGVVSVKLEKFYIVSTSCTAAQFAWTVTNITGFGRFELERSSDGTTFSTVGTVPYVAGTSAYSYKDNGLSSGGYLYRLKLRDADGSFSNSNILPVKIDCGQQAIIVYPNPTRDKATISGLAAGEQVQVYNAQGTLLMIRKVISSKEEISLLAYPAGMYLIKISDKNGKLVSATGVVKEK